LIPDYFSAWTFLALFVFGVGVGFSIGIIVATIPFAVAQTPTVINPENPTSGLKFLDQKAYIYTIPPVEIQAQQQQQSNNGTLQEVILPLLASGGAYIAAKFNADKKHKENAGEILKGKEVSKELAKVTYDMNPEAASKIEDAPLVKKEVLAEDVTEYGQKVAKK
jgi:hypothetical protein